MFRSLFLIAAFFCLFLPCAHAKVPVKDSQFGFSYELPVGFKEGDKNVPGHDAADVVQSHVHPGFRSQPGITVIVERLHAPLEKPGSISTQQEIGTWKTFRLPVERIDGVENGETMLTLQVRVPLTPEAMRISVSGPVAQEKKVRNAMESVLSSLDGPSDWKPDAAPKPTSKPAEAKTKPVAAESRKPLVPATQPAAKTQQKMPETKSRDWTFYLAIILGPLVFAFIIYVRVRHLMQFSKRIRYGVLASLSAGLAIPVVVGPEPFGTAGHLAWLAFCALGIAFAIWRIAVISKQPESANQKAEILGADSTLGALATKSDLQIRMLGLLMLVVSGIAVNWEILTPLRLAETEHPSDIRYSGKVILLLPLCIIFSSALVIFGKDIVKLAQRRQAPGRKVSVGGIIFLIVIGTSGVGLLAWFHAKLRALGYNA